MKSLLNKTLTLSCFLAATAILALTQPNAINSAYAATIDLATNVKGILPAANTETTAVTPGSYTCSSITVDTHGRVTVAASGSCSGGGGSGTVTTTGTPASGNMTKFSGAASITNAVSGTDYSAGTAALGTGIVKSTTTTGALSVAVASDFPVLNQSTTGNAGTASALAATPAGCAANTYANTIAASGNLGCVSVTNAATTATSANTASTIVARDASGNFSAGNIAASLSGVASGNSVASANETFSGNKTFTGAVDASGATSTKAIKSGTVLGKPATCALGEEYFATDATAGQNLYFCTASNTWTQQLNSGGSGTVTTTGTPASGNMTKFSGSASITNAVSGTDYSAGTAALGTGIVKSTTTTGALSVAVASDFPVLNQSTTGNAGTADAINSATTAVNTSAAAAPSVGQVLTGISATAATWQTPNTVTYVTMTAPPYSCDKTGVVDCTAATQTALNTGAKLYYPDGDYLFSATLYATVNGTSVTGESSATTFRFSNATADLFVLGAAHTTAAAGPNIDTLRFSNFTIAATVNKTAGWAFNALYPTNSQWDMVRVVPGAGTWSNGIYFDWFGGVKLDRVYFGVTGTGIQARGNSLNTIGSELYISGGSQIVGSTTSSIGLYLGGGAGGVYTGKLDISTCGTGIKADSVLQTGVANRELFIDNQTTLDSSSGWGMYVGANPSLNVLEVNGLWLSANGTLANGTGGMSLNDTALRAKLGNVKVDSNKYDGIQINNGTNINISGGIVHGNSGYGIYDSGAGTMNLGGVTFDTNGTASRPYHVYIPSNTPYLVSGNVFKNNYGSGAVAVSSYFGLYSTATQQVHGNTGNSTDVFTITGGNVGIGGTPTTKFHVLGSSASGDFAVTNNSASGSISVASLLSPSAVGDTYFSIGRSLTVPNAALVGYSTSGGGNYAFLTTYGRPASDLAVYSTGNVGVGAASPTARLHIGAGTAAAGTGPLKFTSGPFLTAPEVGLTEFLTDDLAFTRTTGAARRFIGLNAAATSAAPTISSGFGTTPTIVPGNGSKTFQVNVGTGGTASSGVLALNAAPTGWNCHVDYNGSSANMNTYAVPTTITTVTLTNQTSSTGVAVAWPASQVLNVTCANY